jgi:hypothetical protein
MTAADAPCDLCSLPVGIKPFSLAVGSKTLHFCCEGCRGIFQMLHDITDIPADPGQNGAKSPERSSS